MKYLNSDSRNLVIFIWVFPRVCAYFHLVWTARKLKLRDRTLIKKANMKLLLFSF